MGNKLVTDAKNETVNSSYKSKFSPTIYHPQKLENTLANLSLDDDQITAIEQSNENSFDPVENFSFVSKKNCEANAITADLIEATNIKHDSGITSNKVVCSADTEKGDTENQNIANNLSTSLESDCIKSIVYNADKSSVAVDAIVTATEIRNENRSILDNTAECNNENSFNYFSNNTKNNYHNNDEFESIVIENDGNQFKGNSFDLSRFRKDFVDNKDVTESNYSVLEAPSQVICKDHKELSSSLKCSGETCDIFDIRKCNCIDSVIPKTYQHLSTKHIALVKEKNEIDNISFTLKSEESLSSKKQTIKEKLSSLYSDLIERRDKRPPASPLVSITEKKSKYWTKFSDKKTSSSDAISDKISAEEKQKTLESEFKPTKMACNVNLFKNFFTNLTKKTPEKKNSKLHEKPKIIRDKDEIAELFKADGKNKKQEIETLQPEMLKSKSNVKSFQNNSTVLDLNSSIDKDKLHKQTLENSEIEKQFTDILDAKNCINLSQSNNNENILKNEIEKFHSSSVKIKSSVCSKNPSLSIASQTEQVLNIKENKSGKLSEPDTQTAVNNGGEESEIKFLSETLKKFDSSLVNKESLYNETQTAHKETLSEQKFSQILAEDSTENKAIKENINLDQFIIFSNNICETDNKKDFAQDFQYHKTPFLSKNKDENDDLNNEDWDLLRKLQTDEERYAAVRKQWKNQVVPDPNENLTTYLHRWIWDLGENQEDKHTEYMGKSEND